MKKSIFILATLGTALFLTSCNSNSPATTDSLTTGSVATATQSSTATTKPTTTGKGTNTTAGTTPSTTIPTTTPATSNTKPTSNTTSSTTSNITSNTTSSAPETNASSTSPTTSTGTTTPGGDTNKEVKIKDIKGEGKAITQGWVIAKNDRSVVVSDGEAGITAFGGKDVESFNIGDYVKLDGDVVIQDNIPQFATNNKQGISYSITSIPTTSAPEKPQPKSLTQDILSNLKKNYAVLSTMDVQLYTWEATAKKVNSYMTLNLSGTDILIEPRYASQTIEENHVYDVTAAVVGYNDQNSYVPVILADLVDKTPNQGGQTTDKAQKYGHVFKSGEISDQGGDLKEINGLVWNTTALKATKPYIGYSKDKGIQIGSSKNPETSGWTIKTTLPSGTIVTSLSVELAVAADGSATYDFQAGSSIQLTNTFNNKNVQSYGTNGEVKSETNEISITLTATKKAMYLKSISFTAILPEGSKVVLSDDAGSGSNGNQGGSQTEGGSSSTGSIEPGKNEIPSVVAKYNKTSEQYYEGFNWALKGSELLNELRTTISKDVTAYEYNDTSKRLIYTDENPEEKGTLLGVYDGASLPAKWDSGKTWNKEHIWPVSRMKINGQTTDRNSKGISSDLFNLRAAKAQTNGNRGNKVFDEKSVSEAYYPNLSNHDFRGDVARTIFYMYVRYDGLNVANNVTENNGFTMGNLSTLLKWDREDSVDSFEKSKNERVYQYQGNRNPFVDSYDKNLAALIFNQK